VTESVAMSLPLEPESARRVRDSLQPFREHMDPNAYTDLRLIASELLVEALLAEPNPRPGIEMRAETRGDRIRLEMTQGKAAYRLPAGRPAPGDRGWALTLVWRLAEKWGLRRESQRATVWLEMPTVSDGRHPPRAALGR
jgi:hypothetical protein